MAKSRDRQIVKNLLSLADIRVGGNRPWDIHVHDDRLYKLLLRDPSMALGDGYMEGDWEVKDLHQFFDRIFQSDLEKKVRNNWRQVMRILAARLLNLQSQRRARQVATGHYDLSNHLFELMLDDHMVYTCAYWADETLTNLEQAQEAKLELVCRKLKLRPGMLVLDIGCGWGSFAKYAAKNHGVSVIGVNISVEQLTYSRENCKGLDVDFWEMDYRHIPGGHMFDRVVSLGMFEHVGYKNYPEFMKVVDRAMRSDGLFLLHTIGSNTPRVTMDPWVRHHIFPEGMLPSATQVISATEGIFILEDLHNFGPDYARTLDEWQKNFRLNYHRLKHKYPPRFFRMWTYWLTASAASFRARREQLFQFVFSKGKSDVTYRSVR